MRLQSIHPFSLATLLLGSALWSCNKLEGPTASAGVRTEQRSLPTAPTAGDEMMDQARAGCPMSVPGAAVTVTDTQGGVALDFTTEGSHVDDLRTRVRRMAQMYGMHHERAGMVWHRMGGMGNGAGHMAGHMGHMAGAAAMPAARATMMNTDLGTRLELQPTDAGQVDALRAQVRGHQARLQAGQCWMLQVQPAATAREAQE